MFGFADAIVRINKYILVTKSTIPLLNTSVECKMKKCLIIHSTKRLLTMTDDCLESPIRLKIS